MYLFSAAQFCKCFWVNTSLIVDGVVLPSSGHFRNCSFCYLSRSSYLSLCPSPDIYCCGLLSTRKSDCTGLPQSMLVCGSTPAQRGQSRIMMKGSMSLISWYNKGHFRFLANAYSPTKKGKKIISQSISPLQETSFFLELNKRSLLLEMINISVHKIH